MPVPRNERQASTGSFEFVSLDEQEESLTPSVLPEQPAPAAAEGQQRASGSRPPVPPVPAGTSSPAPPGQSSTNAAASAGAPAPEAPLLSLLGGFFGSGGSSAALQQQPATDQGPGTGTTSSATASGSGSATQAGTSTSGSGSGGASTSTADNPVDEFEKAIEDLSKKTAEAAQEAKESLAHLAQGISSWFAHLDLGKDLGGGSGSGQGGGGGGSQAKLAGDPAGLQAQLGLEAGEAVLESFACQLLQTYTCTCNFYTPVQTIPFSGTLHITSQRVCFTVDASSIAPIKVPVSSIKTVAKQAATQAQPERIVVQLAQASQTLTFAHFALKDLEMDSALALLEHMADSAAAP